VFEVGVDGYEGKIPLAVNLRLDLFLPLCVFMAAVIAAPASRLRRALSLLRGVAIFAVVGIVFIYLSALVGLADVPGVLALSEGERRALAPATARASTERL